MEELMKKLKQLNKDEHKNIYKSKNGSIVSVLRTDKIGPHDFAVCLKIPRKEEFRPTHVRLLFDLYLKRTSDLESSIKLFNAIQKIYEGEDPEKFAEELSKIEFKMQLDSADVNLYYTQLLMIEQEFNYGEGGTKKGRVEPPREFLMRFIRWVKSGEEEIDKIITNAVRNWPPPVKYAK